MSAEDWLSALVLAAFITVISWYWLQALANG